MSLKNFTHLLDPVGLAATGRAAEDFGISAEGVDDEEFRCSVPKQSGLGTNIANIELTSYLSFTSTFSMMCSYSYGLFVLLTYSMRCVNES